MTDQEYEVMEQIMDRLEDILCSYQGRGHQSVYVDMDSLALLVSLIVYGQIKVELYSYDYDADIEKDEKAVGIYRELAPQTRWRTGCHTQIEQIRMNALKEFAVMGTPAYHDYIWYADVGAAVECGEILPYEIFQLFTDMLEVNRLYIFPYPFRDGDRKPTYYSFEPTQDGREEMKKYIDRKWEKVYRIVNGKGE